MNTKLFNMSLVKYEIRNLIGNIFTVIFGFVFPIGMCVLMGNIIGSSVPEEVRETTITSIFITTSMIVPLATILVGYAATFSQELEKAIPLRFKLFGYKERDLVISKICASLIFMTISLIAYIIICYAALDIQIPTIGSALLLIGSLYLLAIVLFILAHGISLFFKKFGPTYGITMSLYFVIMILSGLFGIQAKDFPKPLRLVAQLFPTTYMNSDFASFWTGGRYNFLPFIYSFILLGVISCIVLFIAVKKDSRRIK